MFFKASVGKLKELLEEKCPHLWGAFQEALDHSAVPEVYRENDGWVVFFAIFVRGASLGYSRSSSRELLADAAAAHLLYGMWLPTQSDVPCEKLKYDGDFDLDAHRAALPPADLGVVRAWLAQWVENYPGVAYNLGPELVPGVVSLWLRRVDGLKNVAAAIPTAPEAYNDPDFRGYMDKIAKEVFR
jgi:hypothetical protein